MTPRLNGRNISVHIPGMLQGVQSPCDAVMDGNVGTCSEGDKIQIQRLPAQFVRTATSSAAPPEPPLFLFATAADGWAFLRNSGASAIKMAVKKLMLSALTVRLNEVPMPRVASANAYHACASVSGAASDFT
eukprot:Opistho-2@6510